MRKRELYKESLIDVNDTYEAESIEEKVFKMVNNKEPIGNDVTPMYTERKDGVQPQFNVRTDRFDIAIEAMDKVTASAIAKREERQKVSDKVDEIESTQATE